MNFCPPADFGGIPAAPQARQAVNFVQNRFGFGSINAPNKNTLADFSARVFFLKPYSLQQ